MMPVFKFRPCAVAALLLTLSIGSQALTLGRVRGAAVVAQPLSLTVSVSASPGEDVSDICFDVDVFYGENKVEGSKISVVAEAPAPGQTWQVRIVSQQPVDEPVVTVYVRSTCSAKTSRRYVLLADLASDPVAAASALPLPLLTPLLSSGKEGVNQSGDGMPLPAAVVASPVPVRPSKPRVALVVGTAKPLSDSKAVSTGKARLKLAPLDLTVERVPALKASDELLSQPTEDMQKRGEAAALWRALNITPEDVLRDASRLQGLESQVQKLTEISSANQQEIKNLLIRSERAEDERYRNPVVIGLGVLTVIMAVAGFWFMRRQQSQLNGKPWWGAGGSVASGPDSALGVDARPAESLVAPLVLSTPSVLRAEPIPASKPVTATEVDLELDFDVQESSTRQTASVFSSPAVRVGGSTRVSRPMGLKDFSQSLSGSLRAINTQEMLDIRQQADFFMTLGQHDDAIALLEGHIADSVDSNPSVYLDLLKILHTLSRKTEFDHYREDFNSVFTGQVPEYADFLKLTEGLDVFPELCAHLVKLWPSHEAQEFIESCMVQQPDAAAHLRFDLEAFKELLLLHAVGARLVSALDGTPAAFSASKAMTREAATLQTGVIPMEVEMQAASISTMEVDLELDMPACLSPAEIVPSQDNLIDFDVSGLNPGNGNGNGNGNGRGPVDG